jgi:eukaryotic-like serine/threonine-protein kinase
MDPRGASSAPRVTIPDGMNVCATCGRQWQPGVGRCPVDGGIVTPVSPTDATAGPTSGPLALAIDQREELAPGTLVGEYQIERLIGAGGMGRVYGARHPVIGKRAAIKVLNARYSADQAAVARFVQEAQAVNQIGHANIVDIFSFGALPDGRSYFVMEWLQGETLGQRLARGRMNVGDAVAILIALTRALEAAHSAGVIHRDLKPDNVFLVAADDELRVKLLDFGIAKLSVDDPTMHRTATGVVMGTPLYMSPEQAKGTHVDAKTDLYSLGVIAYAMMGGETPFEREASAIEVLAAHISKPPPPPRTLRPDIPPTIDALILELLAKQPEQRPTLAEARSRLKGLMTTSSPFAAGASLIATPPGGAPLAAAPAASQVMAPPIARARGRGWLVAGGLGTVAVAIAVFFAVSAARDEDPGTTAPTIAATTGPSEIEAAPVAASVALPADAYPAVAEPETSPEPPPALGALALTLEPVGANVTVDGKQVELSRGKARVELAPGSYRVAAQAPGHKPFEQAIMLDGAEEKELSIKLERRPRPGGGKDKHKPDADAVVNPFGR